MKTPTTFARLTGAVLSTVLFAHLALAQPTATQATSAPSTPAVGLTDGEVRKIDKEQAKITLRHGRIENLDMAPMTMVFRVNDPALLTRVQPGDKVRFAVERIGGALVVTSIEAVK